MKYLFIAKLACAIAIAIYFGYLSNLNAIKALETAITGAIGAIVGGVLAALAFSFSIMSRLTKDALANESTESSKIKTSHRNVTKSLISDVKTLIWCLAAGIFLPVYREIDIPFLNVPNLISQYISKSQLISGLEILVVFVSISVLFEVCSCMFQTFASDMESSQNKECA